MIIHLSKFGTRFQGKTAGRRHYARLCGMLTSAQKDEVVFLDFDGIDLANGSWLNMAISPLFRWAAESQNDFFPIISNFPATDLDELELVAQINQQCYPVTTGTQQPIKSILIIGPLDDSLRTTLDSLSFLSKATGAELARKNPDQKIQATAWNNRLKELYDMRLLYRQKKGRQQFYSIIAEEVTIHG